MKHPESLPIACRAQLHMLSKMMSERIGTTKTTRLSYLIDAQVATFQ